MGGYRILITHFPRGIKLGVFFKIYSLLDRIISYHMYVTLTCSLLSLSLFLSLCDSFQPADSSHHLQFKPKT